MYLLDVLDLPSVDAILREHSHRNDDDEVHDKLLEALALDAMQENHPGLINLKFKIQRTLDLANTIIHEYNELMETPGARHLDQGIGESPALNDDNLTTLY